MKMQSTENTAKRLEARAGIEPANIGFADPDKLLNPHRLASTCPICSGFGCAHCSGTGQFEHCRPDISELLDQLAGVVTDPAATLREFPELASPQEAARG